MADHGVTCSMSRSGNVWDNAAMESFFSFLEIVRTARKMYRTKDQARPTCSTTSSGSTTYVDATRLSQPYEIRAEQSVILSYRSTDTAAAQCPIATVPAFRGGTCQSVLVTGTLCTGASING